MIGGVKEVAIEMQMEINSDERYIQGGTGSYQRNIHSR